MTLQSTTRNSHWLLIQYCLPLIRLSLAARAAEETAVVSHQQVRFDSLHHVQATLTTISNPVPPRNA